MIKMIAVPVMAFAMFLSVTQDDGCGGSPAPAESSSGIKKVETTVKTGSDGLTVEQRNVRDRLSADNTPGSIKHLYVISPFSGQVIFYSTVRGKVTSGGKRLSPKTVSVQNGNQGASTIHGYDFKGHETTEVLEDDGTYGDSAPYIYWWDVQGRYHQQFLDGGIIIHVSDQPIPVKSVTINMEAEVK